MRLAAAEEGVRRVKNLVVYFSRKGRVAAYARERAQELGADVLELRTPEHTGGILGFWWCGRFGMHRWPMTLLPCEQDVADYDHVLVCTPMWVFSVSAPVRAFLAQNAGRFHSVEYAVVHFSRFPMRVRRIARTMDALCGAKHTRATSVCCPWGLRLCVKEYDGE